MNPTDIVRTASTLRDHLKLAIGLGAKSEAPLTLIIDELQARYKGFSPKYEALGRTLRPYAQRLNVNLPQDDGALHDWITRSLDNLRKGHAPLLANLIVYSLAEERRDYLISCLSRIDDLKLISALPEEFLMEIQRYESRVLSLSPPLTMNKQSPENVFHQALKEEFNIRDWEIAAHRILQERRNRTGVLDLSKLRIDALPDSVRDMTWLEGLSLSVTSIKKVNDLNALTNLRVLHCSYGKLRELPNLDGCGRMIRITCGVTGIESIAPVEACPELEQLYCGSTRVSDLTPLRSCEAIRTVHCEDTLISDLSGLEHCQELRLLDCADTSITSLRPIERLYKLETLILNGCHIEENDPDLWTSPNLKEVIFCRGSIKGVPAHILSRSFDENCLPRLRQLFE